MNFIVLYIDLHPPCLPALIFQSRALNQLYNFSAEDSFYLFKNNYFEIKMI